ncbi:hypothetical protein E2C01_004432 [Portunus trituberculatus]|uniref:Uncharacterized protein n=1 Tax=Portunus trituberculatus TaxID=210409 RepID=A0A5B7CPT5_PORTR|nr:hypothetical protein [Portunus trituberculatus]
MIDTPDANKAIRYNLDGTWKNDINFSCTDDTPKTLGVAEGRVCLKRVGRGVSPIRLGPLARRGVAPRSRPALHGVGCDRVGSGCEGCPTARVYGLNYNGCSFRAGVVLIVCIKSQRCRGVDFRFLPDTGGGGVREERQEGRDKLQFPFPPLVFEIYSFKVRQKIYELC